MHDYFSWQCDLFKRMLLSSVNFSRSTLHHVLVTLLSTIAVAALSTLLNFFIALVIVIETRSNHQYIQTSCY